MDPKTNPYAPGAGTNPPELAGRSEILHKADIAIDRCRHGLSSRGLLMVGLRGVGKTVLLNHIAKETEAKGLSIVSIEVPEKKSLPAVLIPALRNTLLKMDRKAKAQSLASKTMKVLGSFVGAMKFKYDDIEFGVDLGSEEGIADTGDLENDLSELFIEIGKTAKSKKSALILFIDEIQYLHEDQFAALIVALHKCTQHQLPILLMGAGLPQLVGQAGKAKSYAERLFEYPQIGSLTIDAAKQALVNPAHELGVKFTEDALKEILTQTKSYPYFLQEWGKHTWDCAEKSPIRLDDARLATMLAITELDASFFRVRFDRLTPGEKKYLRAMADLPQDAQKSGNIAELMGKDVQNVAPIRASLIKKGMIYSISHGDNSFTVPLFEEYMKRVMPILD